MFFVWCNMELEGLQNVFNFFKLRVERQVGRLSHMYLRFKFDNFSLHDFLKVSGRGLHFQVEEILLEIPVELFRPEADKCRYDGGCSNDGDIRIREWHGYARIRKIREPEANCNGDKLFERQRP